MVVAFTIVRWNVMKETDMTQETEALIASDEDLTKLFAGKPTQYRKSKSLPKFTGEAMRACAKINRIFFDEPD